MKKQNLVRPGFHDACGVGFIAESTGKPSKRVIELSFKALELMVHRGATLADNHTGDGTGILPGCGRAGDVSECAGVAGDGGRTAAGAAAA